MKLTSHWVCMEGWGVGGSREQPLNGLVSQNGGLLREVFQCFTNDSIVAPSATMSKHLPPSSFPWTYRICKLLASPCPVWIRNVPSGNVPPKRMPEPKLQVQCIHTHQTWPLASRHAPVQFCLDLSLRHLLLWTINYFYFPCISMTWVSERTQQTTRVGRSCLAMNEIMVHEVRGGCNFVTICIRNPSHSSYHH